ncbi:MAG: PEP-CTERM sorting domain-containing protein [Deltaproteobacteria bacterium]|nr:PEP-CTERM sorting domain-containing protein [Deltaproteobacteria bacterium]
MQRMSIRRYGRTFISGLVLAMLGTSSALAISSEYFVAVDSRTTVPSGTYAGLPSPNSERLTFLVAHSSDTDPATNHFHGIGTYSYSGPAGSPTINSTNANNNIPESFTGQPPLGLYPGTGADAGMYVNQPTPEEEYSNLTIESIQALNGFAPNSPEDYLFRSSGGRWMSSLADAVIHLVLVDITNGLHIRNETGSAILQSIGDHYLLGDGNNLMFTPTFWVDGSAPIGAKYSATFLLTDVGTANGHAPFLDSGTFTLNFSPTPEPGTVVFLMSGIALLCFARLKKAWLSQA